MEKDGCTDTIHEGKRMKSWMRALGYETDYMFAAKINIAPPVLSRELQNEIIAEEYLNKFLEGLGISREIFETVDPYEQMRNFVGTLTTNDSSVGINNGDIENDYDYRDPESMAIIKEQLETLNQQKEELEKKLDSERKKSDDFAAQLAIIMQKIADKL